VTVALACYRLVLRLAEPLTPWLLKQRQAKGKEDPARLGERLGRPSQERGDRPLVWMHGASVGETLSQLPLIDRLGQERPDIGVLVTSGTTTSAAMLAHRLPLDVLHQYAPLDTPAAVSGFLDHWRPDLAIFVEGEIWPNLLLGAKARGVRLALLSARITERSAAGWRRLPASAAKVFGAFDLVLPQDEGSASRLRSLGARVDGRLNLKLTGAPLPGDPKALATVEAQAHGRPLLLAASTHTSDDAAVLQAFAAADPERRALLVIVPRHTERGVGIAALARSCGFSVTLRSRMEPFGDGQVHVADTLGELGVWFRVARGAYIGGGMEQRIGGHNPLEAARLGCPVISGPEVRNWTEVYAALDAAGGAVIVRNAAELGAAFARMLNDPNAARSQAIQARNLTDSHVAALDAGWDLLQPLLPEPRS
jgi:3-deoxy-D-manno-octulosonic-acid transferase